MGGRGASSGISNTGKVYGTEYTTLYQSGNIKFIKFNFGTATAPFETMTKGRVYVTINNKDEPKFITYHDKINKRFVQIDLIGKAHYVVLKGKRVKLKTPHKHKGYEHDEKGTFDLSDRNKKMVERVTKTWKYYMDSK